MDINNIIERLDNLIYLKPATFEQINNAEKELGLQFSDEYKQYLSKYGVISANGIELTGIIQSARLNVVEVTKNERNLRVIPSDMYVVENIGIEGIVLLQNNLGEIYELSENNSIKKIYNSLFEYIEKEHII